MQYVHAYVYVIYYVLYSIYVYSIYIVYMYNIYYIYIVYYTYRGEPWCAPLARRRHIYRFFLYPSLVCSVWYKFNNMPTSTTYMDGVRVRFSGTPKRRRENRGEIRPEFKIIIDFRGLRELRVWSRISLQTYRGGDESDLSSDGLSDDTMWFETSVWASCVKCHNWKLAVCEKKTDMRLCTKCRFCWLCDSCRLHHPRFNHNCKANKKALKSEEGKDVQWARNHNPPSSVSKIYMCNIQRADVYGDFKKADCDSMSCRLWMIGTRGLIPSRSPFQLGFGSRDGGKWSTAAVPEYGTLSWRTPMSPIAWFWKSRL